MTLTGVEMVEPLRRLVQVESGSRDPEGLAACADVIDQLCRETLGSAAERRGVHLIWRREGERPVLLLCHYDTVWPTGTLAGFPFTVQDGVARGPGVFDMKGGIVIALHAVRETSGPVTILFTGDEEIGSPTSRSLIEAEAQRSRAVLVLEPGDGTAVKVARKGTGTWRIEILGRAAHAGLEPERGANALEELSHLVRSVMALARPEVGTTVTPTMASAGSADNVVAESAWLVADVRVWTAEEAARLERSFAGLVPTVPDVRLSVTGGMNRGPLERKACEGLYERLTALGYDVGAAEVGGASDGNFTAALGVPTLDGLGPVGGGAHARDEHLLIDELPGRAEMVARLLADLHGDG